MRTLLTGSVLLLAALAPVHAASPHADAFHADAFGDSISVGLSPSMPHVRFHAVIGEQFLRGLQDAMALRRGHDLQARVVVELGTNGPIPPAAWYRLVNRVLSHCTRIVLVAPAGARAWIPPNDQLYLRAWGTHRRRVRLVYWPLAVERNPRFLGPDGIHPTRAGQAWLRAEIVRGLWGV